LVRHQAVDVALDQERTVLVADGGAGDVGSVEKIALRVDRRFGGVQILRLLVDEAAATEGDNAPLEIADGEHEAASETSVDAGAVVTADHEADALQRFGRHALAAHEREEAVPPRRGESEAEALGDVGIDAAPGEVLAGRLTSRLPEPFGEE